MAERGKIAFLHVIPDCDFCKHPSVTDKKPAKYDGKTTRGPWAYMCEEHFKSWGVGLGLGRGQRLVVRA